MRIGLVCPYSFDHPGGVQAHILDLAQHMRAGGHVAQVIGPCSERTEVPDFVTRGGRSVPIPYNGSVARLGIGPGVERRLRSFLAEGDFDVLHIHEPNSPSYSMAALRVARGPIVATYHASAANSVLLRAVSPALKPLLEKIRGGIAVSEMARRWQVQQLGTDPVLIPNGVDTAFFERAAAPTEGGAVEAVFLGRIDEPRKGLDVLMDALAHLHPATRERLRLTVIGGGTPVNGPFPIPVTFVGRVDDAEKAWLLGAAQVYVAPNTGGESFGIVLVEAMAAGCAVVASRLEAFSDVTGRNSVLVPAGDPHALAGALDRVVADDALRRELAIRGQRRARQYDWDHVAAQVLRVYETVADGTKVVPC